MSEGRACFRVTVIVKAKDIEQAEGTTVTNELTDILSLLGNYGLSCSLTGVQQVHWEIDEEGRKFLPANFRFRIHAIPVGKIEPTMLKKSIAFLNRLHRFSHRKQEIIRRALTWYNRGNLDVEKLDSFIDYWIALETIAQLYNGKVEPYKCPNCTNILRLRPIGGSIIAFLEELGLAEDSKDFQELNEFRGKLLHTGRSIPSKVPVETLRSLVKKMIKKIVLK